MHGGVTGTVREGLPMSIIMSMLPRRECTAITDASGYSGRKSHWRDVDYGIRCTQDWVKTHITIEEESLIIMSYSLTESNVHESKQFWLFSEFR